MEHKQTIAMQIALQTHVLQTCPIHHHVYCDDDVDPSSAFALAVELVRQHRPYVGEFHDDAHALTDLLSETIGAAPTACPSCASERATGTERDWLGSASDHESEARANAAASSRVRCSIGMS